MSHLKAQRPTGSIWQTHRIRSYDAPCPSGTRRQIIVPFITKLGGYENEGARTIRLNPRLVDFEGIEIRNGLKVVVSACVHQVRDP
eukprot:Skav228578  [mRNA]  locus=scaffold1470:64190:71423:- [translate_table: standard]